MCVPRAKVIREQARQVMLPSSARTSIKTVPLFPLHDISLTRAPEFHFMWLWLRASVSSSGGPDNFLQLLRGGLVWYTNFWVWRPNVCVPRTKTGKMIWRFWFQTLRFSLNTGRPCPGVLSSWSAFDFFPLSLCSGTANCSDHVIKQFGNSFK